jgi:hypothetical protein
MKRKKVRPPTGVSGLPAGTDVREQVRELVNRQGELEHEGQVLRAKLQENRHKRQDNEYRMIDTFIDAGMYWLLKINHTQLRKFITEEF